MINKNNLQKAHIHKQWRLHLGIICNTFVSFLWGAGKYNGSNGKTVTLIELRYQWHKKVLPYTSVIKYNFYSPTNRSGILHEEKKHCVLKSLTRKINDNLDLTGFLKILVTHILNII